MVLGLQNLAQSSQNGTRRSDGRDAVAPVAEEAILRAGQLEASHDLSA
jgi:hypothetical protein